MRLTIPPAYHPASSLLGRLVRRWAADDRQAESLYVVAVALVLVTAALLGPWVWMRYGAGGAPGSVVMLGIAGLLGGGCLLGWRPAVRVHVRAEALEIRRGTEVLVLPYERIHAAERISAAAYHRHWRRYAATRVFVNRLPAELLLLRTAHGPVVLGLAAADLARLETHLADRLDLRTAERLVHAA